jgi:TRAP-type mannitol/chloroaromatic compound transport system permease small subunit
MSLLLRLSRVIDLVNSRLVQWSAWLIIIAILVSAINAIIRKLFDTSSNAWLELQWVLFGAVFLICASWTMLANEHIRIDIVNNMLPRWVRNWIEIVGHSLFLLPIAIVMTYLSWPFFIDSAPKLSDLVARKLDLGLALVSFDATAIGKAWSALMSLGEQSNNAGGLPVWPAKLMVPVGFTLLLAQGLSELIKRTAIMQGMIPDNLETGGHHAVAEAEAERLRSEIAPETERRQSGDPKLHTRP